MADLLRSVLIVGGGVVCGLAVVAALHYFSAFREEHARFDLALSLTMIGIAGLSLYTMLVALERLGEQLRWSFPLALVSVLALVFGLLGMIVERGRLARWRSVWGRH